jgi:hypothetical protein
MEPARWAAASLEDAARPKASQATEVNIVEWYGCTIGLTKALKERICNIYTTE